MIAASNRPELIDDALLRPGRLDQHVEVAELDEAACRDIFEIYTRGRPLANDVDLDTLAGVSPEAVDAFDADTGQFEDAHGRRGRSMAAHPSS